MRFNLRRLLGVVLLFSIAFGCIANRNRRIGFANELRQIGAESTFVWMGACRVRDVPATYMMTDPNRKLNMGSNPVDAWLKQDVYTWKDGESSTNNPNEWNPLSSANWNLSSITVPIDAIDEQILNRIQQEPELIYLVLTTTDPYNIDRAKVERLRTTLPSTLVLHPENLTN